MSKLDDLMQKFNKEYNEDIGFRGIPSLSVSKVPLTSPTFNYATYGGLPRGRLIEFFGEEGGGKTTTALDACANFQMVLQREYDQEMDAVNSERPMPKAEKRIAYLQKRGAKRVVYVDCENTLNLEWAELLGVDVEALYLLKPMSQPAEDVFQMILDMIETDEVGMLVIDSLGFMVSKQEYEKDVEERTYGGISLALTRFSKQAQMLCTKHDCVIIAINQLRDDLNARYPGAVKTPGGRAWRHNCSVRIMFRKGKLLDETGEEIKKSSGEPAGNLVEFAIEKTKVFSPNRRLGSYTLRYEAGIDNIADTAELALLLGYLEKSGSWYTFVDKTTGEILQHNGSTVKLQGMRNIRTYLEENLDFMDTLTELMQEATKA